MFDGDRCSVTIVDVLNGGEDPDIYITSDQRISWVLMLAVGNSAGTLPKLSPGDSFVIGQVSYTYAEYVHMVKFHPPFEKG